MRICLDTNVLLQLFGTNPALTAVRNALLDGRFEWAISNEIMLEYEEVITRLAGAARWQQIASLIGVLRRLHGNIVEVQPTFRFGVITVDPDDNKFVDCAIAAGADFVVTQDRHFIPLNTAGYCAKPVTPEEFAQQHLAWEQKDDLTGGRAP